MFVQVTLPLSDGQDASGDLLNVFTYMRILFQENIRCHLPSWDDDLREPGQGRLDLNISKRGSYSYIGLPHSQPCSLSVLSLGQRKPPEQRPLCVWPDTLEDFWGRGSRNALHFIAF